MTRVTSKKSTIFNEQILIECCRIAIKILSILLKIMVHLVAAIFRVAACVLEIICQALADAMLLNLVRF